MNDDTGQEADEPGMNPQHQAGSVSPDLSEHDQLIRRMLSDPANQEAISWLQNDTQRTIGACETNQKSIEFVRQIYDLGAMDVFAVKIHPNRKDSGERSGRLVVKLPEEPTKRQEIFAWCKRQGDSLGFSPESDRGESHLFLLLD
jgi:hypothetical protein